MFHQREQDICVLCSIERHLEKIKRKAIKAGYQDNIMIVSGVESLLNVCKYNHDSGGHIYFTLMLITFILPRRNSFYELVAEITNNFIEHREVAYALIDMLVLLSKYNDEFQSPYSHTFDNNFKRIFTEPEAIYREEFSRYMYPNDHASDDTDSDDADSEAEIEDFNDYYQTLAPSKEEQLDRLEREIKMKLCDDCLIPYKDQACDCWLQEIGEDIFSK